MLDFSCNEIEFFPKNLFFKLVKEDFGENNIYSLKYSSLFIRNTNLRIIIFYYNVLNVIRADIFDKLTKSTYTIVQK